MWHTENTKTKQEEVTAAYDEQVLIQDAWDESLYARVGICNRCGHEFLDPNEDITIHMEAGCWSSWHSEPRQVGTTHHDAVYQTVHHECGLSNCASRRRDNHRPPQSNRSQ